ncbi:uncharacterized protein LOC143273854 [Peromyscus maniculatus bairdii]|uniref:uncharacterized protein LOC143273854 n=1 Tax=Peromyscus maniculatus bairdii TaxID=230844 RepID=UPI003FD4480A
MGFKAGPSVWVSLGCFLGWMLPEIYHASLKDLYLSMVAMLDFPRMPILTPPSTQPQTSHPAHSLLWTQLENAYMSHTELVPGSPTASQRRHLQTGLTRSPPLVNSHGAQVLEIDTEAFIIRINLALSGHQPAMSDMTSPVKKMADLLIMEKTKRK